MRSILLELNEDDKRCYLDIIILSNASIENVNDKMVRKSLTFLNSKSSI